MNCYRRMTCFLLLFMGFFLFTLEPICADEIASPAEKMNYNIIAGNWQRTDGNYLITVKDVLPDGLARVEYFNPRSIRVAQSAITTKQQMIELYIKFQDKGYEGSTYRLYYYAEKDALAGFYYQAPTNKTYEVIFLRKSG